jgi:hypothetical protein
MKIAFPHFQDFVVKGKFDSQLHLFHLRNSTARHLSLLKTLPSRNTVPYTTALSRPARLARPVSLGLVRDPDVPKA